jgi:hypothetical protein
VVIPLSAISPPSTLTVETTTMNSSLSMKIPSLDFAIDNFALGACRQTNAFYSGPAPDIFRIVNSVATQGSVVSLTATAPCSNCIYTLDFYGPALQCVDPNANISSQILNKTRSVEIVLPGQEDGPTYYTGFVPSYNDSDPADGNLTKGITDAINALFNDETNYPLDYTSTDFAKTFLTYNITDVTPGIASQCGLYNQYD